MTSKIVTLTSDFGLRDPYVAEMKAVILSISPGVTIVDVTHEIEKFNIRLGALMLATAVPSFPLGTVHVAVVDPGVGTDRRTIIIQTQQCFLVGPDNGLLVLAAEKQGVIRVHEITNPKLMSPLVSSTFHGRDVFAPAAAHIVNGVSPNEFGKQIRDVVKPKFAKVVRCTNEIIGEVLHIDGFGNVITNISSEEIPDIDTTGWLKVELPNKNLKVMLGKTYGEAQPDEALILVGSHGYVELAVNRGSAAEKFHLKTCDRVKLVIPVEKH